MTDSTGFKAGVAKAIRDTGRALLVDIESIGQVWVPHSVIHDDSEVFDAEENAAGKLVVKEWFAEKEGWTK